jgi:hypothetical protein
MKKCLDPDPGCENSLIRIRDKKIPDPQHWSKCMPTPVLRIRILDPVLFHPLDPGSGSEMNFFRIPDPEGKFFGEIWLNYIKNP